MKTTPENVYEDRQLFDRTHIFEDRKHAGKFMGEMLRFYKDSDALVLGIPAGGVPVAAEIAGELNLLLDVAAVNKITLPWTAEAGYGAVAFDGTVRLNEELVKQVGLSRSTVEEGIQRTREKVQNRNRLFRGDRPTPRLADRTVILVDDGLASGFTMQVAVAALRNAGASKVVVAVPTGPIQSVERISHQVDRLYCANIRTGVRFAVAEAYENWYDVSESEVTAVLTNFQSG
mgnify:CR=1 FL=1